MIKKILFVFSLSIIINISVISSPLEADTTIYLITCGPGTDTYSIYGHSALRVVIPEEGTETIYNWGVFDFSTPNFAWKFAKGRLDYLLQAEPIDRFLQGYFYEQRIVYSQKINLSAQEKRALLILIQENLKPENISYRYDFFYDDCSTRIRDLLEKAIGEKLLYPPVENVKDPTFRQMISKYQSSYPWLEFGIDLIMGSPGDKRAPTRDRMFLPLDMQKEMMGLRVNRNDKLVPLLQNPEVILDFFPPEVQSIIPTAPIYVFTLIFIFVVILSAISKTRRANNVIDLFLFTVFSILSVLMVFFNFFTDHLQMKWNLNIIWLNPFIVLCLFTLIINKKWEIWFRIVFVLSLIFLLIHFVLPQSFNNAIVPLLLMMILRSSARGGYSWNPFGVRE